MSNDEMHDRASGESTPDWQKEKIAGRWKFLTWRVAEEAACKVKPKFYSIVAACSAAIIGVNDRPATNNLSEPNEERSRKKNKINMERMEGSGASVNHWWGVSRYSSVEVDKWSPHSLLPLPHQEGGAERSASLNFKKCIYIKRYARAVRSPPHLVLYL